jgi:electron transport complex protein RnfD
MVEVTLATVPVIAAAAWFFGIVALLVVLAATLGAIAAESLLATKAPRGSTLRDGSGVLTGVLLGLTLPPTVPLWMAFLGGFVAIALGKQMFGGLGQNLFNPALVGRAFMMASFPLAMTAGWAAPRPWFGAALDAVTTPTPLGALRERGLAAAFETVASPAGPWQGLLLGFRPGSIGETSLVMVALGAGLLLARGIIRLTVPVAIFAGVALVTLPTGHVGLHLASGGLWLGAFFMATDYVTSPTTRNGQIAYGVLIGVLTGVIRLYGGYPEGICYAILLANAMVPAFNLWFRPKRVAVVGAPS